MERVTRLALVAMPWSQVDRPSAAISALASYVRKNCPTIEVACYSAFVDAAAQVGFELYDVIAQNAYNIGEPIYASLLYDERRSTTIDYLVATLGRNNQFDWPRRIPEIFEILDAHTMQVANRLSEFSVVGLTTCFGQLFANLFVARAIKRLNPDTVVVLGGSTVSAQVGSSLLREYSFLDYIIQGEGERPLATLLRDGLSNEGVEITPATGILSRTFVATHPQGQAQIQEVDSMDQLPLPDYDEYAALAKRYEIRWAMPVEGSRGCWWDRTKRKGNPRSTCYFCNLNVQWSGYREKQPSRLADEIAALSEHHRTTRLFFVDNIMRASGVETLADSIQELGKQFEIFYELRANIAPYELLRLWEVGLTDTQFGIESLSNSVLQKMGKGTRVIDNLQAMKLCAELGITNRANLITDFPGTTADEVDETRRNIMRYALPYEPLRVSKFQLGLESTVAVLSAEFGISNIRNADQYRTALPPDVCSRLQLFDLDYDKPDNSTDWSSIIEACREWRNVRATRPKRLIYRDGNSFLQVIEESAGETRELVLPKTARDIYLFCCGIRTFRQIARKFDSLSENHLSELLSTFVKTRIMYRDGDRFLSLAIAPRPTDAAQRIRQAHFEDLKTSQRRGIRLPVLS